VLTCVGRLTHSVRLGFLRPGYRYSSATILQLTPTLRTPELHHHLREQTTERIRLPRPHAPPQSMSAHKPEFPGNVAPKVVGSRLFSKKHRQDFPKDTHVQEFCLCHFAGYRKWLCRSRHRNSTAATITSPFFVSLVQMSNREAR
jgi:hypothetical protein